MDMLVVMLTICPCWLSVLGDPCRHSVDLFLDFINIFRQLMIIMAMNNNNKVSRGSSPKQTNMPRTIHPRGSGSGSGFVALSPLHFYF